MDQNDSRIADEKPARVDRDHPCQTCGKTTYCWFTAEVWACTRMAGSRAVHKTDKHGVEYWLHFRPGAEGTRKRRVAAPPPEEPAGTPPATPAERDVAYRALLDGLVLDEGHRVFPEAHELGYRTCPTDGVDLHAAALRVLRATPGGEINFLRIPGTFIKREQEAKYTNGQLDGERTASRPRIVRHEGMYLPRLDVEGRIVALDVRLDDATGGRYRPFRGREEGSTPGQVAHVAMRAAAIRDAGEGMGGLYSIVRRDQMGRLQDKGIGYSICRITEGVKKADIATLRSGILTIGLPGAGAWKLAEEPLQQLGVTTVRLAFDADARANPGVAGAMARAAIKAMQQWREVELEVWDPTEGKGIDDAIASGTPITVIRGREVLVTLREWLSAAGSPPNPELDARLRVVDAFATADGGEPRALLDPEVLSSLALLDRTMGCTPVLDRALGIAKSGRLTTEYKQGLKRAAKTLDEEQAARMAEGRAAMAEAQGRPVFHRGDNAEIASQLVADLGDDTVYDEGAVWRYDAAAQLWVEFAEFEISRKIQGYAGSPCGDKVLRVNDVKKAAQMTCDLVARPGHFREGPAGFGFTNTFVEVMGGEMHYRRPHADHRVRQRYDFDYDPHAEAPQFQAFLRQIFATEEDLAGPLGVTQRQQLEAKIEEKIVYIQEFLGLCLIGRTPQLAAKALILLGDGANGKSTLLDVVRACFPDGTVCGLSPHHWGHDQKVDLLAGRRLNIVGELPTKDLQETETYKGVITGDLDLTGKVVFERPYQFRAVAGHIFAANSLPASGDGTHGFARRNVIIPMFRTFLDDEQDRGLAGKLQGERPGIVRWMLDGAVAAVRRGGICPPPRCSAEAVSAWLTRSDAVRSWLLRHCQGQVTLQGLRPWQEGIEELFTEFANWAKEDNRRPLTSDTFRERVRSISMDLARRQLAGDGAFFGDGAPSGHLRQIARSGLRRSAAGHRYCPVVTAGQAAEAEVSRLLFDV